MPYASFGICVYVFLKGICFVIGLKPFIDVGRSDFMLAGAD